MDLPWYGLHNVCSEIQWKFLEAENSIGATRQTMLIVLFVNTQLAHLLLFQLYIYVFDYLEQNFCQ
jgi:hypothetical protein